VSGRELGAGTNIREAILGCLEVRAEEGLPLTVKTIAGWRLER